MLEEFKKKLSIAQGRSEFVIVVFCDIRGFSKFSTGHESPDIAMFIKRFFINIISNHFPTTKFVKPTGDGLLLIFPYSETDLSDISRTVISGCFAAIEAFPNMFESDPMINFETPNKLGFGITRGPACCLYAEDEILDYSGRLLNLAARLNDFARPLGIVIDGNYKLELISDEFKDKFKIDKVFVRGITESTAIDVFYTFNETTIPKSAKSPIDIDVWKKVDKNIKYSELKKLDGNYRIFLPSEPVSMDKCKLEFSYPNRMLKDHTNNNNLHDFRIQTDASGHAVTFPLAQIKKIGTDEKIPLKSSVRLTVHYVAK